MLGYFWPFSIKRKTQTEFVSFLLCLFHLQATPQVKNPEHNKLALIVPHIFIKNSNQWLIKDHFLINDEFMLELSVINRDLNDDLKINAW